MTLDPSAAEYILDNFAPTDRTALLVPNRDLREAIQRITSAQKAASPEFQAWLRYKNANGSDIYIGMNPLKGDARTRTKQEIESIRHVYLDLDHGASEALEAIRNSPVLPKPNYVLNSSPEKHQVVWKGEGMDLQEAEGRLHAMAHTFRWRPAATDATRVLRVPGFANKKYHTDFCVEALRESTAGLSPKTVNTYSQVVKSVAASAVNEEGEQLFPRKWNHEFIDMPLVDKSKQNSCTSLAMLSARFSRLPTDTNTFSVPSLGERDSVLEKRLDLKSANTSQRTSERSIFD